MKNKYMKLADSKNMGYKDRATEPCNNCGKIIDYWDIAKEIRGSSLEEVICQECWNKEE